MIVEKTPLEGLLLIKPNVNKDKRGYFYENYRDELFEANGLPTNFRQDNQTKSVKGTLRGLHYQLKYFLVEKTDHHQYDQNFPIAKPVNKHHLQMIGWRQYLPIIERKML